MDEQTKRGSLLLHTLMGIRIVATGSYVPPHVVTNEDLARLGMDPQWILQRTGIRERRHAAPDTATSDLCVEAGRQCLQRALVSAGDVDLLVVGTFTPDRLVCSTAATVQDRLGIPSGAIEISAACAGFVYALATAAQFVATGASRRALVIGADCNSRVIDTSSPKIYPLFGDGAGAVLIERGTAEQGLMAYTLGADGSGAEMLYKEMGGSRLPPSHEAIDAGLHLLVMDGKGVFKWATRVLCDSIEDVLKHARLELADIDLFVLHQANMRIIDAAADYLGIDRHKLVINLDRYGNTSGGSVPLALDEAWEQGRVHAGDKILMSGYGAGLAWGTAIFRW
ncbi:MAG: beta-ketoacyl-ACP synthase III [Pirellulales bacterium]